MPNLPDLLPPMDYQTILDQLVKRSEELLPGYIPSEGDDVMLVCQDFAYREMLLRQLIQHEVEGQFLTTATGAKLDHLAETRYGLYRLQGSKPYTTATFSLSMPLDYDVTIPSGYQLTEDGGVYFAHTTQELHIPAGETSVNGTIELDAMVAASEVRTEIPVTPIPFLDVSQDGDFLYGGDVESDDEFKERIRTSLSDKSTAGSAATYRSFALKADERIDDVSVYSPAPGVVNVIYYAKEHDDLMQSRITDALNAEDVRPLTDQVQVEAATEHTVDISATLIITRAADAARVTADARAAIEQLLSKPQIGKDLLYTQLIRAMMVDGVEDVSITAPSINITVEDNAVAVLGSIAIETTRSTDVY